MYDQREDQELERRKNLKELLSYFPSEGDLTCLNEGSPSILNKEQDGR